MTLYDVKKTGIINKKEITMDRKVIKGLEIMLILMAGIILLNINSFIFPMIEDGPINTGEFYLMY